MGWFSGLKLAREAISLDNVLPFPTSRIGTAGVVSPWSEGQLKQFVWNDILGTDTIPVTRAEAMSLPSIAAGRATIINELAGKPLRALTATGLVKTQPAWLYRTNTATPPWFRMAHTLDDWIFYGQSLWTVERGAAGQITDALRVPYDRWEISDEYEILVDKLPVPARSVIYLQGPFEGLLNVASRTIRAAVELEKSWAGKARNPIPAIVLQERDPDGGMTQEEATPYVKAVSKARRDPDGSVMFIPGPIEASFHGEVASDLMIEARNAVKLDIAGFLNLNPAKLGAALPKSSLNYETQQGQATELADRMPYWTNPLEARLSMDDVCPQGQRIRFDFSDNPNEPEAATGPFQED